MGNRTLSIKQCLPRGPNADHRGGIGSRVPAILSRILPRNFGFIDELA